MKKIKLHIFAIGITLGSTAFLNIKDNKKKYISNENKVFEAEKCIFTMHL